MRVIFFAGLKNYFPSVIEVDASVGSVSKLMEILLVINKDAEELLKVSRFAQGANLLNSDSKLEENVPVAILPPSSGG